MYSRDFIDSYLDTSIHILIEQATYYFNDDMDMAKSKIIELVNSYNPKVNNG